jgi:hypothetical protein
VADRDRHDEPELAELRQLAERLQPGTVTWEEPPAELWDRIAATVGEEPAAAVPADASVTPLRGAPRRRGWILATASAAAALLIAAILAAVLRDDDTSVLAATELARLGDSGSGRAELVERDGSVQLRVETEDLDAADGYLELWMIDPTVTKLVSLGPLRADGRYDVPAGVTPAEFPIVDISAEPLDGDPTHSGQSLLRGELPL